MAGMTDNRMPGVYRQDVFPAPEPGLLTGVPVFLGTPMPARTPSTRRGG